MNRESVTIKEELIHAATAHMQRRYAIIFCVVLALVGLLALPFTQVHFVKIPVFIAYYTALALFADLLTAYLLFVQFLSTRTPALAVLTATYLFSGLMVVPYALTFPGIFSATGLLNANTQTANWLWVFWHAGFPFGILLYAAVDARYARVRLLPQHIKILSGILLLCILLSLTILSLAAIVFSGFLPTLIVHGDYSRMNTTGIGPALVVINIVAYAAIVWRMRRGTIIQAWLSVAAFAWSLDVLLNITSGSRYSFGWYLSRINSITAATIVLCALLYEINRLYIKIAYQNKLLEHQNEHLEQQNTLQCNFVSVVSHEFRSALTSIQGFSEIMQIREFSVQETREYIGDICSEAKRLNRLITDLLDLERMKAGNTKLHIEPVDVNMLIESVVNRMHSASIHHTLHLDLERFEHHLAADSDKLIQVMTNLISNAMKYSPEGGEVVLRSRREGEHIHVSVQDCGIGIPQEKLEEVFQQYTRVETDQTHYIGGTGLGLPIVRQIVEMHGGKVWAESSPGKGSTFHVQLQFASKILQ